MDSKKVLYTRFRDPVKSFAFATAGASISTAIATAYGLPVLPGIASAYATSAVVTVLRAAFSKKTKTQILYDEFTDMVYKRDRVIQYGTTIKDPLIRNLWISGSSDPIRSLKKKIDIHGRAIIADIEKVEPSSARKQLTDSVKSAMKGKSPIPKSSLTEATLAVVVAAVLTDLLVKKMKRVYSTKMQEHLSKISQGRRLTDKDVIKFFKLATQDYLDGYIEFKDYRATLDDFITAL